MKTLDFSRFALTVGPTAARRVRVVAAADRRTGGLSPCGVVGSVTTD